MGLETGAVVGQVGMSEPQVPVQAGVDMRRQVRREVVEVILDRLEHLPAEERSLLLAIFQGGQTAAQVALLLRVDARVVRRRVRLITARVLSREFALVVRRRDRWPRERQRIGQMFFVEGRSLRGVARALGLSVYSVRQHCDWIRAGAAEVEWGVERERRESA